MASEQVIEQGEAQSAGRLRYSTLAIAFHWTTAALFVAGYLAIYYRIWFTTLGEPANLVAVNIHTTSGIIIGLIAVLRLLWHRVSPPPDFETGRRIEHFAAKAVHYALYFFMIMMPVTGYLGLRAPVAWLGMPKFEDTALYRWLVTERLGLTWEEWEAPLDWVHQSSGAFVIWVLVGSHASAALYHHYIRHDDVLSRMIPFLRSRNSSR